MKTWKSLGIFITAFLTGTAFYGCYTVVMWPSDSDTSQLSSDSSETGGNYSSDIYYNSDCLSCHSQAELDDRYYDLNHSGITVVHGESIDPYGWRSPIESVPWWVPEAPAPVAAISIAGSSPNSSVPAANNSRRRTDGSARNDGRRPENPSADNNGSSPSAPAPTSAVSVAPTAPPPPTATGRSRSSDNNQPNTTQPRSSGSPHGR
jgi:hypothetical protein